MKQQTPLSSRARYVAACACLLVIVAACARQDQVSSEPKVSGALSGVRTIGQVMEESSTLVPEARTTALLGVFVSEYLSVVPAAVAAESALLGIGAQMQIAARQSTVNDPDYQLLQAFADALQVDVPDMLNRSVDRQEQLDKYTDALTNVATRANDRFKELESVLEELDNTAKTQNKDLSLAERALSQALRDKDFSVAGELQKDVNEKQAIFAETDLQRKQIEELVDTLDRLLTLYGEKIVAIQSNREALIAGTKVVDVPGIEELDVIERQGRNRASPGDSEFDELFEDTSVL